MTIYRRTTIDDEDNDEDEDMDALRIGIADQIVLFLPTYRIPEDLSTTYRRGKLTFEEVG